MPQQIGEVIPTIGPNAPGVAANIYWADVDTIDVIVPINLATLTVPTTVTMLGGAVFKLLATIREETNITDDQTGPTDTIHFIHQLVTRVKGMEPTVMAALNACAGRRCVVLVTQPDGTINIIGNKTNYAEITSMVTDSGKAGSTDRKGTVITIKSIGHIHKLPTYTGTIPL